MFLLCFRYSETSERLPRRSLGVGGLGVFLCDCRQLSIKAIEILFVCFNDQRLHLIAPFNSEF
jgi:hypothetical protein